MSSFMSHHHQMHVEHAAWIELLDELRKLGVSEINKGGAHEHLHDLITRWGEELVQLRIADPNPNHARDALQQRRRKVGA